MNNFLFSGNDCLHQETYYSSEKEFNFCKFCGVLFKDNNSITCKPNKYNYQIEIDPFKILHNLKKQTSLGIKYLTSDKYLSLTQDILKDRTDNIDLLKKLIVKFKFSDKTFYLSALYLDVILTSNFLRKNKNELKQDLIALACLLLAAKFSENDPMVPNLNEIQALTNSHYYNSKEIRQYEDFCVKLLQYKLDLVTAFDYLQFFLNIGIVFNEEKELLTINIESAYQQSEQLLFNFVSDIKSVEFPQFHIACACVALTRNFLKLKEKWPDLFSDLYKINFDDFVVCYESLLRRYNSLNRATNDSNNRSQMKNFIFDNYASINSFAKHHHSQTLRTKIDLTDSNFLNSIRDNKNNMTSVNSQINFKIESDKSSLKKEIFQEIFKDNVKIFTQNTINKNPILRKFSTITCNITNKSVNDNKFNILNINKPLYNSVSNFSNISNLMYKKRNSDNSEELNQQNSKYQKSFSKLTNLKKLNLNDNLNSNCSTKSNSKNSIYEHKDAKERIQLTAAPNSSRTESSNIKNPNEFSKKNTRFNFASSSILKQYSLLKKSLTRGLNNY